MPLFRINGKLIHFVHIPKTGGASIETLCAGLGAVAMLSASNRYLPCSPQHIHDQIHQSLKLDAIADWSFAIVREPLARLVSEYRMRRRQAELLEANPTYTLGFVDPDDLPRGERAEFDAWAEHVLDRCRADPFALDNHIRPQAAFLSENQELFRLEDGLEPIAAKIAALCGLPETPEVPHRNASERTPVTASKKTVRRIVAFYEADYATLGFERPREDAMAPSHDDIAAALMAEPEMIL